MSDLSWIAVYKLDKKALLANLQNGTIDDSSTAALNYGRKRRGPAITLSFALAVALEFAWRRTRV